MKESGSGVEDRASKGRAWILVIVLLVMPGALYAAVPVVPFLPLTTAQRFGVSAGLVVTAEVVFLGAALFVGNETVPRSWFRKR